MKTLLPRILSLRLLILISWFILWTGTALLSQTNSNGTDKDYRLIGLNCATHEIVEINQANGSITPILTLPFETGWYDGFDYNSFDGFLYISHPMGNGSAGFYKIDIQ